MDSWDEALAQTRGNAPDSWDEALTQTRRSADSWDEALAQTRSRRVQMPDYGNVDTSGLGLARSSDIRPPMQQEPTVEPVQERSPLVGAWNGVQKWIYGQPLGVEERHGLATVAVPALAAAAGIAAAPEVGIGSLYGLGQAALNSGIMGGTQLAQNALEEKPLLENVPSQAATGALFGLAGDATLANPSPLMGSLTFGSAGVGSRLAKGEDPLSPGGLLADVALGGASGKIARAVEAGMNAPLFEHTYSFPQLKRAISINTDLPPIPVPDEILPTLGYRVAPESLGIAAGAPEGTPPLRIGTDVLGATPNRLLGTNALDRLNALPALQQAQAAPELADELTPQVSQPAMSLWDKLRSGMTSPARFLRRMDDPYAQNLGLRAQQWRLLPGTIEQNAAGLGLDILGDLTPEQRADVTRLGWRLHLANQALPTSGAGLAGGVGPNQIGQMDLPLLESRALSVGSELGPVGAPITDNGVRVTVGGYDPTEGFDPAVVEAAKRLKAEYYDPMGELGQRLGVKIPIFAKNDAGRRFIVGWRDFVPREDYGAPIVMQSEGPQFRLAQALRGVNPTQRWAYSRTMDPLQIPEDKLVLDSLELLRKHAQQYAPLYAKAYAFGAEPEATNYGQIAQYLYDRINTSGPQGTLAKSLAKNFLDQVYSTQRNDFTEAMSDIMGAGTRGLLGGSAITQVAQAANPIWRTNLEKSIEGWVRYARDPWIRAIDVTSGSHDPGFAATIFPNAGLGGGEESPGWLGKLGNLLWSYSPGQAIAKVEAGLRGPLNAGFIPYYEDLARQAQDIRAMGGTPGPALLKQLDELMIPYTIATEPTTPSIISQVLRNSADRAQFHTGIGQVGTAMTNEYGRPLAALMTYPVKATQAFQDDILEPLLAGGEMTRLGAGRLGRMLAAGLATESLREGLSAAYHLRKPDPMNVLANLANTQGGYYSVIPQAGWAGYQGLAKDNWKPANRLLENPTYSPAGLEIYGSLLRNALGATHGQRKGPAAARAGIDALSLTPLGAFLRGPGYALTKRR